MKFSLKLFFLFGCLFTSMTTTAQFLAVDPISVNRDVRPFGQKVARLPVGTEYREASLPVSLNKSSAKGKGRENRPESGQTDNHTQTDGTVGTHIQGGHSGNWFNAQQNGHGIVVEVIPSSNSPTGKAVVLYWYAYLENEQVWLVAVGPVINQGNRQIADMDAYIYHGNDFPPFYTTTSTQEIYWGTMSLSFNGCEEAIVTWDSGLAGYGSGSLDMQRLTSVMQTSCNPTLGGDSGGGGGGGGSQDDHGNTWQTGTALGSNPASVTRTGNLETQGDADVFTFSISGTRDVQLYTTGPSDTYGTLYQISGSSEVPLAENDDDGSLNFGISVQLGSGQYSLHVTGFAGSSTGPYTLHANSQPVSSGVQRTIHFDNRLLMPVNILLNGVAIGSVDAATAAQGNYVLQPSDVFSFEVIQPYGDSMIGVYNAVGSGSGQINYRISTVIGNQWFFIPHFTNNSATDQLIAVNWGLQSENRCNCTAPAFTENARGGYFLLYSNSNVYLFEQNYGGAGVYWENFASNVHPETGRINFVYP